MSNRGMLDEITSPVSLGSMLPGIYRDLDLNIQRVTAAFDAVVAPVWLVLDNLDAYFDPALAPADFVAVLAAWVGLAVDDHWSDEQVRRLVAGAVEMYRWRGTRRGVVALVEAYTGVTPDIVETGGTTWRSSPGAVAPGSPTPGARIRIRLPAGAEEDLTRLTRLVAESVPAHVPLSVEIVRRDAT